MRLEGSCHCGAVRFSLEAAHPYPFNLCYCSICRKTAGGGGYAINLGGDFGSLAVEGEDNLSVYQAMIRNQQTGKPARSPARRHFCRHCGSALWLWDPRWPELVHPHASAIDTPLPVPPERTHLMLASKPDWVEVYAGPRRTGSLTAIPRNRWRRGISGWAWRTNRGRTAVFNRALPTKKP